MPTARWRFCLETKLMYFSDASLEESLNDDIRFPARYWDPWQVAER